MKLDPDLRRLRWMNIGVSCLNAAGAAINAAHRQWVLAFIVGSIAAFSAVLALMQSSQQRTRDALKEMQRWLGEQP